MARSDWDIHGIIVYMDDSSNIMDIYEYAERKSKYIPIDYIAGLLTLSDQRFVDILNEPADSKKHLITSAEEEFRNSDWYFSKYQVFSWDCDLTVELADFEYWLDDNYEFLKENRATPKEDCYLPDIDAMQARIADLEAENANLRDRVVELENAAEAGDWDEIPYTLWREVLAMRGAGMTDTQIAVKLHDKGQGASKAQLGALLYSGKSKMPAQKTLQDYGTELFR